MEIIPPGHVYILDGTLYVTSFDLNLYALCLFPEQRTALMFLPKCSITSNMKDVSSS